MYIVIIFKIDINKIFEYEMNINFFENENEKNAFLQFFVNNFYSF